MKSSEPPKFGNEKWESSAENARTKDQRYTDGSSTGGIPPSQPTSGYAKAS